MCGDIRQNLSSIKNIRFVKQLVSTGIIFINQEEPALHWYLSDRELDGSSSRSWSTSVQLSFLEMFWHLLTPFCSHTNGYKATKFDDYEDCGTTLWIRLKILKILDSIILYSVSSSLQLKLQQSRWFDMSAEAGLSMSICNFLFKNVWLLGGQVCCVYNYYTER